LQQRNQAMPTMAARATYLQPHLKQREHVQDNNVLDDTVEGITTDVAGKETHIESYESFDQDIEEAESAAEMDVNQFVHRRSSLKIKLLTKELPLRAGVLGNLKKESMPLHRWISVHGDVGRLKAQQAKVNGAATIMPTSGRNHGQAGLLP